MRPRWSSLALLAAGFALGAWGKLSVQPPTPQVSERPATRSRSKTTASPSENAYVKEGALDYAAWEKLARYEPEKAWGELARLTGPTRWLARKRLVEALALARPDEVGAWMDLLVAGEREQALEWAFTALKAGHGVVRATEIMLTWRNSSNLRSERDVMEIGRQSPERALALLQSGAGFGQEERQGLIRGLATGWLEHDPVGGLAQLRELWITNHESGLLSPDLSPETLAKTLEALPNLPQGRFREELQASLLEQYKEKLPLQFLRKLAENGEKTWFEKQSGKGTMGCESVATLPPSLEILNLCGQVAKDFEEWGKPSQGTRENSAERIFKEWAAKDPKATWAVWQQMPESPLKGQLGRIAAEAVAKVSPWEVSEQLKFTPELSNPSVLGAIGAGISSQSVPLAVEWCRRHPEGAEGTVRGIMRHDPEAAFTLMKESPSGITAELIWDFSTDLMKRDPGWTLKTMKEKEKPAYSPTEYDLLKNWDDPAGNIAWLKSAPVVNEWADALETFLQSTKGEKLLQEDFHALSALTSQLPEDSVRRSSVKRELYRKFESTPGSFETWLAQAHLSEKEKAEWIEAISEIRNPRDKDQR